MSSLYDQLGGEPAIDATVEKFYQLMLADPLMSPFFAHTDMNRQRNIQKKFLTYALKGNGLPPYAKKSMQKAHANITIEDKHYDKLEELLDQALASLGVESGLIKKTLGAIELMREDVLTKQHGAVPGPELSLLDAVGGEAAVEAVVKLLYERILADPLLIPFFAKADMKRQHLMQKKFLVMVLSGKPLPNASRNAMITAHAKLNLSDADFDRVIAHIAASLQIAGVEAYLIEKIGAIAETTRDLCLGRAELIK